MEIGVPKEIKANENRVAITPAGVHEMTRRDHQVFIETGAGIGSGFTDKDYQDAGATIVPTAADAWNRAMVMKVKEPLPEEYGYFFEGQILFTYLHLAADLELTKALVEKKVIGIAYETVQLDNGQLPLLTPMSEIAGRMAPQIGAQFLEKVRGGKGILLGGVPGVRRGKVAIIGGGIVGTSAAKIASGLGADVTILDTDLARLRALDDLFGKSVQTLVSNPYHVSQAVAEADLVIGAVLIPGAKAPKLINEAMIRSMGRGGVVIDVAVDQGGIVETIDRITTHDDPVFEKHGVLHYAVANMPGAVPYTSTWALTNATLPYAVQLASKGNDQLDSISHVLAKGINTMGGFVTHPAVAEAHQFNGASLELVLSGKGNA
ncbi:alanine dehydrogenase [Paenibacillus albiflavus]|uniref:Alanine dehydrogenase n=1 Tax=Paenibacillus albiflavus TaxID=2545760 RepID=A0A4R4EC31_9BACL|nr:alanine dehydrogenase [Paenibacillus albiflavus]TCZ76510.1 alanine dehydrogenase [Paenibacillus albiflavus]